MADNTGVSKTAIIVAIIGLTGTILVAIINKIDFKSSSKVKVPMSEVSTTEKTEMGMKDKRQDGEETIFDDTLTKSLSQSHDCLLENDFRKVVFIEAQGAGSSKDYIMKDESGKKDDYYIIEDNLPKATQIWLSHLKEGERLSIQCMICKPKEGGSIEELYIVSLLAKNN